MMAGCRQAANSRNWEKAELTARNLEDAANPHKPEAGTRVTICRCDPCDLVFSR
jgi:hypothetical protein